MGGIPLIDSAHAKPIPGSDKSVDALPPAKVEAAAPPGSAASPTAKLAKACAQPLSAAKKDPSAANLSALAACKADAADLPVTEAPKKAPPAGPPKSTGGPVLASYTLPVQCPTPQPAVVAEPFGMPTGYLPTGLFAVTAPADLLLETDDLQGAWADTVAWLTRCNDAMCTAGDIVGVNDDLAPGVVRSRVAVPMAPAGTYRYVVQNFSTGSRGRTDITLSVGGVVQSSQQDVFFEGIHSNRDIAAHDILFVGGNPQPLGTAQLPGPDSTLFVFGTQNLDCVGPTCGKFLFNDDTSYVSAGITGSTLLSRLDIPVDWQVAAVRVAVGSFQYAALPGPPPRLNARFVHIREHYNQGGNWLCPEQFDNDNDGLPFEVEAIVGSCDTVADAPTGGVGVAGMNCAAFANFVNGQAMNPLNYAAGSPLPACVPGNNTDARCWRLRDSDNDGLDDASEVFVAAGNCFGQPTPPYYDQLTCNAVDLWWPPNMGWIGTKLVSPLSTFNVQPGVHDIITYTDAESCGAAQCAQWHAGFANSHELNTAQLNQVDGAFSTDPTTCWDGSAPPCPNPIQDIPYMARYHVRVLPAGNGVLDDSVGTELSKRRYREARYHMRFPVEPKMLHVAHYSVLYHGTQGQTDTIGSQGGARWMISSNSNQSALDGSTFIHETGHMRTLEHPNLPAWECDPDCPATSHACANCSTAAPPLWTCGAMGQLTCQRTDVANPLVASVMSYNFAQRGLPQKSASPPAFNTGCGTCAFTNSRFSKGLNPTLDETALNETVPRTWQAVKMAIEQGCFLGQPTQPYCETCATFEFLSPSSSTNPTQPPYCDAGSCYFNWNRNLAFTSDGPVAADITYGRYNTAPPLMCNGDRINDIDEWGALVGVGKRGLTHNYEDKALLIYADSFNGGGLSNWVDWGTLMPMTSSGPFIDNQTYPTNFCTGGANCVRDLCDGGYNPCVSGDCFADTDECTCNNDNQCHSGWCTGGGLCVVGPGRTPCGPNLPCQDNAQCLTSPGGVNYCSTTSRNANLAATGGPGSQALRHVKQFRGPGQGDNIRLESAPQGPLSKIGVEHTSFQLRFDFRWDGMVGSQVRQIIANSGAYEVAIEIGPSGAGLNAKAGTNQLWLPTAQVGQPIEVGRWYRVRVGFQHANGQEPESQPRFTLELQPWNDALGYYDQANGLPVSACVRKPNPSMFPLHGDLRFGTDGWSDHMAFNGLLDNVTLRNFMDWTGFEDSEPATCMEVQ